MKTDQDYIKEGAELADGWGIDGIWLCVGDAGAKIHDAEFDLSRPLPNYIKDALATQLERQYQESSRKSGHNLRWSNYVTDMRRQHLKTDLTMWKLKYIVDSKVLLGS